jgi:hypothetical protein
VGDWRKDMKEKVDPSVFKKAMAFGSFITVILKIYFIYIIIQY